MSWRRLVVRNDWGNLSVHIGGPVVGGAFKTTLPKEKCPPALKAGDYKVKWPNGNIEILPVVMRGYSHQVYDMGHEYTVNGKKPYFQLDLNGTIQEVAAEKLGVEVEDVSSL